MIAAVAEELTRARLLTVTRHSVEIAHEALIHSWPRLRAWIEESRDDLRMRQRIDRAGAEWVSQGRDRDLLLRGTPLRSALEWAMEQGAELSAEGRELLRSSEAAWAEEVERRARAARRSRRIRQAAVTVLGVLTIVAAGASVVAFTARDQATARLAQSLAAQAVGLAQADPRLALALAVESMERGREPSLEARTTLVEASRALQTLDYVPAGEAVNVGDALSVAVTPDGRLIAVGGRDGSLRLFDAATGEALGAPLQGHDGAIQSLDVSPDGRWLVTGGDDQTVRRWDLDAPADVPPPQTVGTADAIVWGVAASPDGSTVAVASLDGTVRLWGLHTAQPLGEPLGNIGRAFDRVRFSPDGTLLLAAGALGEIWLWRLPEGELVLEPFRAHQSPVWSLAFDPSGERFATAGSDGRVRLWDVGTGELIAEPFADEVPDVRGVQIGPDGLVLAGDVQGRLRIWSTNENADVGAAEGGHQARVIATAMSSAGDVVATLGFDHTVQLWTSSDDALGVLLTGHDDGAFGLAVDAAGERVATGDGSGAVRLFDLDTGEPMLGPLTGHGAAVWALDFSANGRRLASGDADGAVLVHDVRTGEPLLRLEGSGGAVAAVRFHGDRLLVGGEDGAVRAWDEDGRIVGDVMGPHQGGVTSMALGPERTLAVADRQGNISLWRPDDGASVSADLPSEGNVVWDLAWSRDRTVLATASADEVVTLWDMPGGQSPANLTPHPGGATAVDFLADEVTVVSSSRDGGVRLWDVALGRPIGQALTGHDGAVWRVVAHPSDARFVTSSEDGTVRVWDVLDTDRACERAAGAFDEEQRRRYLGPDEAAAGCR